MASRPCAAVPCLTHLEKQPLCRRLTFNVRCSLLHVDTCKVHADRGPFHVQVTVAHRSATKEQELISWDEVKDQKEVFRAVRTPDGRQALVKAGGMCYSYAWPVTAGSFRCIMTVRDNYLDKCDA